MYYGTRGLSISTVFKVDSAGNASITDKFKVTSEGALTAISATITGDITATKLVATQEGNIAGWTINSSSIYRVNSIFGNASGMYFGSSGLSITNNFKIWSKVNFNFGDGKLVFDGSKLTFGSDVTISWEQIDSADAKVTQITKDTVTTEYVNALKVIADSVAAENITGTTISGKTISGGSISIGGNFSVNLSGYMICSGASINGDIVASSFKYSDSQFDCSVDSGFEIYNKSDSIATSYSIRGVHGSMSLSSNSLDFYTGNNFNGTNGSFWHDSYGFHFNRAVDIGTTSIRAGNDGYATIVDCSAKGKFYYGASHDYTDDSALSALRGKTVRIYSHGGGVYLGSSGSTAISSDENFKYLSDIDERYEQFFYNLKPTLYKYKIGHRKHIGFGARAVEKALKKAGLNTEEFAGILIDRNVDIGKDEVLDLEGNTHFDELYYLRYEEFISLNTLMLQKALSRITELESIIKEMKG